jgi:osmotically-inducible protein OsmY
MTTNLARLGLTLAVALSVCGAVAAATEGADLQIKNNIENAFNADPYFYAAHVNVSMENGNVVLRGFVFSDWDLRDAIRIATKAAAGRRVVDDLTIEVGGRR